MLAACVEAILQHISLELMIFDDATKTLWFWLLVSSGQVSPVISSGPSNQVMSCLSLSCPGTQRSRVSSPSFSGSVCTF